MYVRTVKEKDGENDRSSHLDRSGVYRVNLGVRRQTFLNLYGNIPARPKKGGVIDMKYDFTANDKIMPHPVYGWLSWLCCLNPSAERFEELKPLIAEAHAYAKEKYEKRKI